MRDAELGDGPAREDGKEMDPAVQCLGIIDNYLGKRNETVVVSNHLYPPIVRYDPSTSGAPQTFLDTWEKMDLSTLFGFPVWEEDVFMALNGAFPELCSIFTQYAKADSKGSSATAATTATMQQTELTDLALDCSLAVSYTHLTLPTICSV